MMQAELTETEKWRNLKIINSALMAGATLFLCVTLFLVTRTGPAETPKAGYETFALVCMALWMGSLIAKGLLARVFAPKFSGERPFETYQTLLILRMALSEGPALAGLVFLITYAPAAEVSMYPKLAVFLLPYFSLMLTGLLNRPSEEDLKEKVRLAKENLPR